MPKSWLIDLKKKAVIETTGMGFCILFIDKKYCRTLQNIHARTQKSNTSCLRKMNSSTWNSNLSQVPDTRDDIFN